MTEEGIEWEGDKRHVETFLKKLADEFTEVEDTKKSQWSGAKTPGAKPDVMPARISMSKEKGKAYRGLAALSDFMAQHRSDIGFAAREVSKSMSDPAMSDVVPLKRLGRYLMQHPRCANVMVRQKYPEAFEAYSDSDWGGDAITRRSTSGGCIYAGRHMLQHWSRTQQVVSLSSAEADMHALTECAARRKGLQRRI